MAEPPTPDLQDNAGRLRRLALGLIIGVSAGALAYFLANTLIDPEPEKLYVSRRTMSRDTFVIWLALVSSVVSFVVAMIVQNRLAKNKWRAERIPRAEIR
jgi:hypothetical protein